MMTKDNILALEKDIENAISLVLSRSHKQEKGIRVYNVQIQREVLNPPGTSYTIRVQAQVTDPITQTNTPE